MTVSPKHAICKHTYRREYSPSSHCVASCGLSDEKLRAEVHMPSARVTGHATDVEARSIVAAPTAQANAIESVRAISLGAL